MSDLTPQERLALIVLALLLLGGAVARQVMARTAGVEFAPVAADTLNPGSGGTLRQVVSAEVVEGRLRSTPLLDGEKIDPNSASAVQLDRLPGIGPALADRIVSHRDSSGRFTSMEDLGRVSGIGDAVLQRIAPHLALTTPDRRSSIARTAKVDLNRASSAELQTLPGIGPAIAARIMAYREENGSFREWKDLEKVSGIGPRLRDRLESAGRLGP